MQKMLVANWKMHPVSRSEVKALARAGDASGVIIAPPAVFLREVGDMLSHAKLGAQNAFWEDKGAYTGEISPAMLKSSGVSYVILGHSERRQLGETNLMIRKKIQAALLSGLRVVFCIGEPHTVRRQGIGEVKAYLKNQISEGLKGIGGRHPHIRNLIVAYEPLWAIGSGKAAFPEDAAFVSDFVRSILKKKLGYRPKFLYGGSVHSKNLGYFLERKEIDGALVGGASINAREFRKMARMI